MIGRWIAGSLLLVALARPTLAWAAGAGSSTAARTASAAGLPPEVAQAEPSPPPAPVPAAPGAPAPVPAAPGAPAPVPAAPGAQPAPAPIDPALAPESIPVDRDALPSELWLREVAAPSEEVGAEAHAAPAAEAPSLVSRLGWAMALAALLFAAFRVVSFLLHRVLGPRRRSAQLIRRVWPLIEAAAWVLFFALAVRGVIGERSPIAAAALGALVVLAIAASWTALRDLAAGLILAAERPFGLGDVVEIGGERGQVKRLGWRVIELETGDGRRSFVPYRAALSAAEVRAGRSAYVVRLDLELPAEVAPAQALDAAREMAASSPWAALGLSPMARIRSEPDGRAVLEVEAFAIDRDAQANLHADLLEGWRGYAG